jgi:hypothetical protein
LAHTNRPLRDNDRAIQEPAVAWKRTAAPLKLLAGGDSGAIADLGSRGGCLS